MHPYGLRKKTKSMDKRLEKLEQMQKEMQEQMQAQMQEQLVKIQQDIMDKMMESQRSMMTQMTQMTQLLNGLMDKGKSPMVNVEENTEYPQYPPGFTPPHVRVQLEVALQRPSITIRPQQFQAGASMNLQTGSGSGDNPINTNIPDLDEIAEGKRTKVELPKQLEDRYKWLEEKFKAIESADGYYKIDAKDLSLDSLVGAAAKWYNQLTHSQIGSRKNLAQAFIKQYSHVTDIAPDRITLQNMEKKTNESFRQYAQ
ncbi:putative DNA double-strand break repair Rad50 ATPase [Gossypium australe]|uniref:Putative DNA double-strand break repair Rad50 ATPase n=1 Tax=Gossypium australe TaxID=47621 RepID=A0A5B6VWL3_9ROSI|nr:putative DNA double-strand break repair Rad50 ATPase [Gossypium australe]